MSRYSSTELVPLPRLTATGAVALGAQVVSLAEGLKKEKALPKELNKPLDITVAAHNELAAAVSVGTVGPEVKSTVDLPALDRVLDATWAGIDDRLSGMARLPDDPKAIEAASLRGRLFPDGLMFLTYRYPIQWAESKARLDRIDGEGLAPALDKLAGKEFLPAIRKAHAVYGDALGLTKPGKAPVVDEAVLRVPYEQFMNALRRYVTKVVAVADDLETPELVDKLLWPLDAWATPSPRRGTGAKGGAAPAGDEPAPAAGSPAPTPKGG